MENQFVRFTQNDREDYIRFSHDFYDSDSVINKVPDSYFENAFEQIINDSPYIRGFMVKEGNKNIGYAILALTYSVESNGLVVWLEELYIEPSMRGRGYGKAFFSFIEKEYAGKASRFRLEVMPHKEKLISLYSSLEFDELSYMQMIKDEL